MWYELLFFGFFVLYSISAVCGWIMKLVKKDDK